MKEGSVCCTEDVLCIFYDSRKEGWFPKQPKIVYLQCGWSRSEWVGLPPPPLWNFPSRPLSSPFPLSYPSPQTPTASALGNGKSWPFVHCSGLYCIALHCIVLQSEYISVHFTGDVPSWPFVQFQPLFGAQTLLQGDVARFMQKLYRSFAHSQALDSLVDRRGRDRQLDVYFGDNECGLDWL